MYDEYKELKNVDGLDALNWKLILLGRPKGGTAEKTEKFGIESELSYVFEDKITEINLFVKKTEQMQRDILIFLNESNAMEMNNIYRVRSVARENFKLTEISRKLLEVPSTVISSFSISKGEYRIEFLFHESEIGELSNILMSEVNEKTDVRVEYLGPSGGYRESIRSILKRTKLTLIGIETVPPEQEMGIERNPMGTSWIRIEKTPLGKGEIKGIYITQSKPSGENVREIVPGMIYFAETENVFIRELDRLTSESRIPCIIKVNVLRNGKFFIVTAVPEIFSDEYIKVISEVASSLKDWRPEIFRVQEIGEWIYSEQILP